MIDPGLITRQNLFFLRNHLPPSGSVPGAKLQQPYELPSDQTLGSLEPTLQ